MGLNVVAKLGTFRAFITETAFFPPFVPIPATCVHDERGQENQRCQGKPRVSTVWRRKEKGDKNKGRRTPKTTEYMTFLGFCVCFFFPFRFMSCLVLAMGVRY